ncbi:MAG: S1C family serine protease [Clostridiaceae bacterium]
MNEFNNDDLENNEIEGNEIVENSNLEETELYNEATQIDVNENVQEQGNIIKEEYKKKKEKKNKNGFFSIIAVAVICAFIGGGMGSYLTYSIFEKPSNNSQVNTSGLVNNNADTPSTIKTVSGGEEMSVTDIVSKVSPAVVGISVTTSDGSGYGSGVVVTSDGYILTNYHVISTGGEIKVKFSDGKEVAAKLVNQDTGYDIALLKIDNTSSIIAVAELGDSDALNVGESVVAIGNPLGEELYGSVTQGIVSAINREVDIEGLKMNLIQTDAAINPGNSGGALINSKGQVVGITNAKIASDGQSMFGTGTSVEGIGFAIPINDITPKIENLMKPMLMIGIRGGASSDIPNSNYPDGVYVSEVTEYGAAERAGLKVGDIITKMDGVSVKSIEDINNIKAEHNSGDKIKLVVDRNGDTINLDLVLQEVN